MNWWNLCLLLLLVAGHTQLWVVMINRLHALPIPRRLLRHAKQLHDVAIIGFPPLLLWFVGLRGPRLITYGQWSDLSAAWAGVLSLCAVGLGLLVISTVRFQLRPDSSAVHAERTEIVDLAQQLGAPPIADGPLRWLAKVPGNEQFSIELSDKRLTFSRLPPAWHGLRILHLSDWHLLPTLDRSYFEAVTEHALARPADLIVFTGDLIDDPQCLSWLPQTMGRFQARLGQYFILGNHDWEVGADAVRNAMCELGWQWVGGRTFTIESAGRQLVIGGDERPWMGQAPDFNRAGVDDFRLLLSHTPDHFRRAQKEGIDLMLAGHVHGGQVVLPVVGPVYAPSVHGVRYAAGVFEKPPTTLYVSRGLAGRHPLRLRCRPEITWLVLEREPC